MNELKQLSADIRQFSVDRDWMQFHTPGNLAKSVAIEAGELLECFQWSETDIDREHAAEEIADVMNYCLQLCDVLDMDPEEIIRAKMVKNAQKYPVEKAKGSRLKYTDL